MNEKKITNCDTCVYYVADEEGAYECLVNFDEDDAVRFLSSSNWSCPYYRLDDEYAIVRKQN
jgi:hypothetical protein